MQVSHSFLSYFNPFSNEHHAWKDCKNLPSTTKSIIFSASVGFGLISFGVGGVALYRCLVGRCQLKNSSEEKKICQVVNSTPLKIDTEKSNWDNALNKLKQKNTPTTVQKRSQGGSGPNLKQNPSAPLIDRKVEQTPISSRQDLNKQAASSARNDSSISPEFRELADYIEKKYPKFDMSKYTNIREFEKAGQPVHFAVAERNAQFLHYLAKAGANFEVRVNDETPLFVACKWACKVKNLKIIFLLIEKGADPFARNQYGDYPLRFLMRNPPEDLDLLALLKKTVHRDNLSEISKADIASIKDKAARDYLNNLII